MFPKSFQAPKWLKQLASPTSQVTGEFGTEPSTSFFSLLHRLHLGPSQGCSYGLPKDDMLWNVSGVSFPSLCLAPHPSFLEPFLPHSSAFPTPFSPNPFCPKHFPLQSSQLSLKGDHVTLPLGSTVHGNCLTALQPRNTLTRKASGETISAMIVDKKANTGLTRVDTIWHENMSRMQPLTRFDTIWHVFLQTDFFVEIIFTRHMLTLFDTFPPWKYAESS